MAMRGYAKRTAYYHYPVELVWKAIGVGDNRTVDPLTEDQFDNTEPAPNTIFTKCLEKTDNEVFAFRMKARGFIADVRVELTPVEDCETKVVFSEDMTFRTVTSYVFGLFGWSVRRDMRSFSLEIHKRLADMTKGKSAE